MIIHYISGKNLYMTFRNSDGQACYGSTVESWDNSNIGLYAYDGIDKGGHLYEFDLTGLASGAYYYQVWVQEGVSPVFDDDYPVDSGQISWNGTSTFETPATQVISLAEAKNHLKVDTSEDDDLINGLIAAATDYCETHQNRKYLLKSVVEKFDEFRQNYRLRYSPVDGITSITYIDTGGATQTLDGDYYTLDATSEPARLVEAYSYSYPMTRDEVNAVTVTYLSGYGTAEDVPDSIKAAIKLLVGHWYEHRESVSEEKMTEVPQGVQSLLNLDKVVWYR